MNIRNDRPGLCIQKLGSAGDRGFIKEFKPIDFSGHRRFLLLLDPRLILRRLIARMLSQTSFLHTCM